MTTTPSSTDPSPAPLRKGETATARHRRLLRLLNHYRFIVATLLLLLLVLASRYVPYGHHNHAMALSVCSAWLLFATTLYILPHRLSDRGLLYLQIGADITAITLLIHASGGVSSGLGMLLILPLALTGVIAPGRIAAMFAAIAALALLGEELYAHLRGSFSADYFQAGLAGTVFFATALLAALLAQRLRESEHHIARQSSRLADLDQLNEHIIQQMQSGILVVDREGEIQRMNRAAARMLRAGNHRLPRSIREIDPELRALASEPLAIRDGTLLARTIPLDGSGDGCSIVYLEESAALAQQAQQMKLASLGRLTASIAHEIRNPIGAISHAQQLLAESPRLDEADRRLSRIIGSQTKRVNGIIESILQLGRGRPASSRTMPLLPWLEQTVSELRAMADNQNSTFVIEVTPPDMEITFDPDQLRQVVWNLCQNAIQACAGKPRIELRGARDPDSGAPFLEIRDNGPGIDPGLEQQIFEPFFTTGSGGNGLGLYIVRELCSANRAQVRYRQAAGGGARFRIEFARA